MTSEITENFVLTGRARIGWLRATWPFARLTVTKALLELNADVIGNLVFHPQDIISIEPFPQFFNGTRMKINHRVKTYPERVSFHTSVKGADLMSRINKTGFLNNPGNDQDNTHDEIIKKQQQGPYPFKTIVFIILIVCCLIDSRKSLAALVQGSRRTVLIGDYGYLTTILLPLVAVLTFAFAGFRKIVLKEGRILNDVKYFFYLVFALSALRIFLYYV